MSSPNEGNEGSQYSEEQSTYIFNPDTTHDTKLIATGGAGKSFCIVHRAAQLVKTNVYTGNQLAILTFSRNSRDDFVTKIREYKAKEHIPRKSVYTIDSFAFKLLGEESKTIDVSILSYAFMVELEKYRDGDTTVYNQFPALETIRCIFVDEAQDLNNTQYRILLALKHKCGIKLHFIGDPNQNIYQFRKASDRYLVNFVGTTFYLTKNYRSMGHIVEFSSFLRPYQTTPIEFHKPKGNLDVTFYAYSNSNSFEHSLLTILQKFKEKKVPFHKIAVLAPTRGYLRDHSGSTKYKGLCYISNIMYQHEIPFVQFYNDAGTGTDQGGKMKYRAIKNHVNLMTFTASKGLEWDYVILVDANAHLISRRDYDVERFNAEQYLLYVACSRPRKNLVIFTKQKYANPHFKGVPLDKYKVSRCSQHNFDFFDPVNLYEGQKEPLEEDENNIQLRAAIHRLDEPELYRIHRILNGKITRNQFLMSTKNEWVLNYEENRGAFMSKLVKLIVSSAALGSQHLVDIYNVIHSNNILMCNNEKVIAWYFNNRNSVTWESWEGEKLKMTSRQLKQIAEFIDSRFDKTLPFNIYTMVDKFYELYILQKKDHIKRFYDKYTEDSRDIESIFHLSLALYAIHTTHYFYIQQSDAFAQELLIPTDNMQAFKMMQLFVDEYLEADVAIDKRVQELGFTGFVDMIANGDQIFDLKCTKDISLKDVIHSLVTCMMLVAVTDAKSFSFNILNLTKGIWNEVDVVLEQDDIDTILEILKIDSKKKIGESI